MALLEVNNIRKNFGRRRFSLDISFSLEEGEAISIIGSSGSGKTTLLRCLNFPGAPGRRDDPGPG
jgi:polar amino acid transport system ATP-binding protein